MEKAERKLPGESRPPEADASDTSAARLASPSKERQASRGTPQAESRRLSRWIGLAAAVTVLIVASAAWFYSHRPVSEANLPPMKVVRFTSYPGKERDPALSPDGEQLAFLSDGEQRNNLDIYVQLIGGERPLRLTSDPKPDVSPAWSPDGSQIVFARLSEGNSDIYLTPSLSSHERKLSELYSVWSEGKALDWSPDGKLLVAAGKTSPQDFSTAYF